MSDSRAQSCLKNEKKPKNRQSFPTGKKFAALLLHNAIALERSLIFKSVREKSDGNAGGRICHPMAVGEMWLPRTAIRRRQETLPPVRHSTAPEPLMLHSAKR